MGQLQFAPINSAIKQSDTAATANALVERDGSGDIFGQTLRAAVALVAAAGLSLGVNSVKTSGFSAYDASNKFGTHPVNATGGAVTATLPAAASNAGLIQAFIKTDTSANAVTIDGNSAETVNGLADFKLFCQNDFVIVQCDGTNWRIIGRGGRAIFSKSADFTAEAYPIDATYYCNTGSGNIVATLPPVAGMKGARLTFVKTSASNTLTLDGDASETINGATTLAVTATAYGTATIECDGSAWVKVAS